MDSSQACVAERCQFVVGDYIDSKWRVDAFLGEGTFGQVFKVRDSRNNTFALKLLKLWTIMASERPNLLKRFDREYETGLIKSDYLVRSLHKGILKGNPYIVMEYCPGGDLQHAAKNAHLDLPLLAQQVLLGLRDLHLNGKVHRDLKPENVLLRDETHAVLTDFGICGDQNNRLTQMGWRGVPQQRFGTIAYMPPEQVNPKRGNATVLPTTDIFSYGVMMYFLFTGSLPFGALEADADVPLYVFNGKNGIWDRNKLTGTPMGKDWLPVIEGCLTPDFKERLQTIDDVLAQLPQMSMSKHRPSDPFVKDIPYKVKTEKGLLLRVMQGEELGKVYILNDLFTNKSSILFVGRATPGVWNHLAIEEKESAYISRQHCTIEKDESSGVWMIRDGQFRTQCPIGLRFSDVLPCRKCTARCPLVPPSRGWKESLNGTFVNSQEVSTAGMMIKPGDIISIGDVKMRVEGV